MRAKVVVNLHYYEDALLEMPRIQECLSLGVPVVSEASQDQNDYREVASAVRFFPQGDIPAMVAAVGHALAQPISSATVRAAAEAGWLRFKFMFDRFLLGNRLLRPTQLTQARLPVPADTDRFVLSLPETIRRRRTYLAQPVSDAAVFDGLRYTPGWLGCGMSYSALARHRLGQGGQDMMVIEDDAFLPGDFEERIAIVRAYLESRDGQWDLFAGLIADLHPETRVLNVEHFDGLRFVTIDRMTSMVCNIYGRSAQQLLAAWNPSNQDADTNTIDCYLERSPGLRVVVALPFVAGLRQGLDSTLWGVDNSHYIERVAATQAKLDGMADAFEQTQA